MKKAKNLLALLIIVAMMLSIVQPITAYAVANSSDFAGGSGTEEDPYLISNKYQLDNVRYYLDKYFKLTCDIEFEDNDFAEDGYFYNYGSGFEPLGISEYDKFTGTFDGNGYAIKNLYINIDSTNGNTYLYAGLFGYNNGTIKNLGIVDGVITGIAQYCYVGGIAAYNNYGSIEYCYNSSIVSATSENNNAYAGGIVGYNANGTIESCYNKSDMSVTYYAGGIAGYNGSGTIKGCYNTNAISETYYAGGIAGYNGSGTIEDCYNIGNITATNYSGGIAGYNGSGTIEDCYNSGNISSTLVIYFFTYASGIAAYTDNGTIKNCYNTGNIFDAYHCGGIIGHNEKCNIETCYNTGNISAKYYAGGIAGRIYSECNITNCNNSGEITSNCFAGGITGSSVSITTITSCYNSGPVTATTTSPDSQVYAGGIMGESNGGIITKCYNSGLLSATSTESSAYVGGITAKFDYDNHSRIDSIIQNCFNMGELSVISETAVTYAGGITGYNCETIKNCYNSGNISATSSAESNYAGGIVGYNVRTISSCYYLDNIADAVSKNTGTIDNVIRCNDRKLKDQRAFTSFTFNYPWTFDIYGTYDYPVLRGVGIGSKFREGSGSKNDPYLVSNKYQLADIDFSLDSHFKLICDIEFEESDFAEGGYFYNNGAGFDPIGDSETKRFSGTFDGNGYAIKNLYINLDLFYVMGTHTGLFDANDGIIKNLAVLDSNISATGKDDSSAIAGGITANNHGIIDNCYTSGIIKAISNENDAYAGGIVASNYGTIKNCHTSCEISTETTQGNTYAGGIAASNYGTIKNCHTSCEISTETTQGNTYAGGIAGKNNENSTIENCYNTGNVSNAKYSGGITGFAYNGTFQNCYNTGNISATSYAGGIIGYCVDNYKDPILLENCYNTGNISSTSYAGGIAGGSATSIIKTCYNKGDISLTSTSRFSYAGGIAGHSYGGSIKNCYNSGNISITISENVYSTTAGGIAGHISGGVIGSTFENCYNVGEVYVSNLNKSTFGGIAGDVEESVSIKNCYYLNNTVNGIGHNGSNTDAIKCTSNEMKKKSTFKGFDFGTVWEFDVSSDEYPYPQLLIERMIITSINQLDTISYIEGTDPDLTDATIQVEYGLLGKPIIANIPITVDMLCDFNNKIIGEQNVYVKYDNLISNGTLNLEGKAKSITSIEITSRPNKLNYLEGEAFETDGMVVKAHYDNNTTETIKDYTINGYDTSTGVKIITITYKEYSKSFTAYVYPREIVSDKYTVENGTLLYVSSGTTVKEAQSNISGGSLCKYYHNDVALRSNDILKTGSTVKIIYNNSEIAAYTVIISGDVDCDGYVTAMDALYLKQYIVKMIDDNDINSTSSDMNKDETLNAKDLLMLKQKLA